MNCEFLEALIVSSAFEELPRERQELLNSIMSTPIEAMDTKVVTTEGVVSEVVSKAEGATPEVVEVLAKVPKSPQTPRPKPTPTMECEKGKKGKQAAILVCTLPRRNPPKENVVAGGVILPYPCCASIPQSDQHHSSLYFHYLPFLGQGLPWSDLLHREFLPCHQGLFLQEAEYFLKIPPDRISHFSLSSGYPYHWSAHYFGKD